MNRVSFHHFGLAVKDFRHAIRFYDNLGYDIPEAIFDPLQDVELILCTSPGQPAVELVKPVGDHSPVTNFLNKNNEMIYHTCYELEDIETDIDVLFQSNRAICVSKPKPAILFDNRPVAFYYLNNVGLVEVLQK